MVASWLSDSRGLIFYQVLEGITLIPFLSVAILSLLKLKSKNDPLRLGFTWMKPAPVLFIISVAFAIATNSDTYMPLPPRLTLAALASLFDFYGIFVVISLLCLSVSLIDQQYAAARTNPNARAQSTAKLVVLTSCLISAWVS